MYVHNNEPWFQWWRKVTINFEWFFFFNYLQIIYAAVQWQIRPVTLNDSFDQSNAKCGLMFFQIPTRIPDLLWDSQKWIRENPVL